jgi:hypothetical protein
MPLTNETRNKIFNILKKNLVQLTPPMVIKTDKENEAFEIIGNKPVPYGSDKKMVPGMYFASIAQRKDSVVFYFFPCYRHKELLTAIPSLNKCLKGKTCFHFKKEEQLDEKELRILLKKGVEAWNKAGYMK